MNQVDTLKMVLEIFKEKASGQSYRHIMSVMKELKDNGMNIQQAIKQIDAFNGFTSSTINMIGDYCQFRTKEIGTKHPNYFFQVCQNKAKEPRVIYRTERMKVNL